jgi:hypothetical protein
MLVIGRGRDLSVAKVTYLHRARWPQLYAIANARETWQRKGLSTTAESLLAKVSQAGALRMDEVGGHRTLKELGDDARALESRILIFGDDEHTDSGAHVKRIETWPHWAERMSFTPDERITPEEGRAAFDSIADDWGAKFDTKVSLPWHQPSKPHA